MVHVFVPVDDIDSIAPTKFHKVVGSIAWVTLAINFHVCMKIWYYLKINPMFLLRILLCQAINMYFQFDSYLN